MRRNRRSLAPAAVAGAGVVLSAATVVLAVADGESPVGFLAGNEASTWLAGLAFGLIGAAVLRDAPGNRLGPLLATCGLLAATSGVGFEVAQHPDLPLAGVAAWAASVLWLPAFAGLILMVPLLFPHGRLPSSAWRWPARAGALGAALAVLGLATTQEALDSSGFAFVDNPLDLPLADGPQLAVAGVGMLVAALTAVAAAVGVLLRMRRVSEAERGRYAWFAAATLCGLTTLLPLPLGLAFALNLASFCAIGIGIVRHRLFDVQVVLSRAVVYLLLSGAAVAVYLVAAAATGVHARASLGPAVLTAVAALLLARAQTRVQRAVDRLLYGERATPDAALVRLGDQLASALSTDEVLPVSVEAVRRALRLPYVAITLTGEAAAAAATGTPGGPTVDFPLTHTGELSGVLTVALRAGERTLSADDQALLTSFAAQVAVAAHGVHVSRELHRARERVVSTREEERSRIHRDLHDGLGPALAGISLGLETASRTAVRDGAAARTLIEELREETAACVDDVRRIVSDLRPPALDSGLVAAVRRHADLLTARTGLLVEVTAPHRLLLPSAVEVAGYRIATEAMTNTARHSGASRCDVVLTGGEHLLLLVRDDGSGLPPARQGTGLPSMRLRAEELGGTCTVTFTPGTGTEVRALLSTAPSGADAAGAESTVGAEPAVAAPAVATAPVSLEPELR